MSNRVDPISKKLCDQGKTLSNSTKIAVDEVDMLLGLLTEIFFPILLILAIICHFYQACFFYYFIKIGLPLTGEDEVVNKENEAPNDKERFLIEIVNADSNLDTLEGLIIGKMDPRAKEFTDRDSKWKCAK